MEFGIAKAKSLPVHAAGLANGKKKVQPAQIREKAAVMQRQADEEERDLAARLVQASRAGGNGVTGAAPAQCSHCGAFDGVRNGKKILGNGLVSATVSVKVRRPYVHDGGLAPAGAAKLLCEGCMWSCDRCACHEYAGFCLRHNFSDTELLPSRKLVEGDNARKMKAQQLSDAPTGTPVQKVRRCGCCILSRKGEDLGKRKSGWLELKDRPGGDFRRALVSPGYLAKVHFI